MINRAAAILYHPPSASPPDHRRGRWSLKSGSGPCPSPAIYSLPLIVGHNPLEKGQGHGLKGQSNVNTRRAGDKKNINQTDWARRLCDNKKAEYSIHSTVRRTLVTNPRPGDR